MRPGRSRWRRNCGTGADLVLWGGLVSRVKTVGPALLEVSFVHADAGYTFRGGWKPRLAIEYDHASGDGRGRRYARFGYRPLWLASRFDAFSATGVRDATGRSGRFAGHQLDSRIRYRVTRSLTLEADATLLAKGRFLRDAPTAPPDRWTRYLSLNATAAF